MAWMKQIKSGEKLALKLTPTERKLLLEGLTSLPPEYESKVEITPVKLTLDELEELGGYIATEGNHPSNQKLQKKLGPIIQKIQLLLDTHTDDQPPKILKIADAKKAKPQAGPKSSRKTDKPAKSKKATTPGQVFQFKINLLKSQPPIWRRIQVQDCTLDQLHEYIQTAMGWENSHLHHFRINEQLFGNPDLIQEDFEDMDYEDSTTIRLSDILPRSGEQFRFQYEYDFGDAWNHEILFEGCPEAEKGRKYPVCLEGKRACPPEDCGGSWGYPDFLDAIQNPDNQRHEELLEWIGGEFDPDEFNPAKATKAMRKGLPDWRSIAGW